MSSHIYILVLLVCFGSICSFAEEGYSPAKVADEFEEFDEDIDPSQMDAERQKRSAAMMMSYDDMYSDEDDYLSPMKSRFQSRQWFKHPTHGKCREAGYDCQLRKHCCRGCARHRSDREMFLAYYKCN